MKVKNRTLCSLLFLMYCWCTVMHRCAYYSVLLSRPFFRSRDQDRDLGHQVLRPRPNPGSSGLETKTETVDFRSRDRDLDKMNSSALEYRDHGYVMRQFTPARRQSPIPVLTGLDVEQLRYRYTKLIVSIRNKPPRPTQPFILSG